MTTVTFEQPRITHEPTIPIALCVLEHRGQHVLWKVLRCPICGKEHRHGAGLPGEDPRRYLSHRSAHCTLGDLRRLGVASEAHGYILQEAS